MAGEPHANPPPEDSTRAPIERIGARAAELGEGLRIHHAPPTRQRRMAGAWCFLNHVGPGLGGEQVIRPGQVNLMTAGQGIAHTEVPLPGTRSLHNAQLWIALPSRVAGIAPAFEYGILPLEGRIVLEAEPFGTDELAYLGLYPHSVTLDLAPGTPVLLLGGEPINEAIVMWWNFVDDSRQAIAQSLQAWERQAPRFAPVAGGEDRRITPPPLPWPGG